MNDKLGAKHFVIRYRTIGLTGAIVVALVFWLFVQAGWNDGVDAVSLSVSVALQIAMHCLYFPDGEDFGRNNPTFVANRSCYNEKASKINADRNILALRNFCEEEYKDRVMLYKQEKCGVAGVTIDELKHLAKIPAKELKKLRKWEHDGKLYLFTKKQANILYRLIYESIPVKPNNPDTILSAVETDIGDNVHDASSAFKTKSYIVKIGKSIVLGAFLAYVGFRARDGITIDVLTEAALYLCTMISTAVFSFSSGEVCQKVYKNRFYVDLSNFIDKFNEWLSNKKRAE